MQPRSCFRIRFLIDSFLPFFLFEFSRNSKEERSSSGSHGEKKERSRERLLAFVRYGGGPGSTGTRWRDTLFRPPPLSPLRPSRKKGKKEEEKETQAQVRFPPCPSFFPSSSSRVAVITGANKGERERGRVLRSKPWRWRRCRPRNEAHETRKEMI